jgi:hypothetical protein
MKANEIIELHDRQIKFDLALEAMQEIEINQKSNKIDRVNGIFILESILNDWEQSILQVTDETRKEKLKVKLKQLYFIHDSWADMLTSEVYARKKSKLLENRILKLKEQNHELKLLVDKLSKQIEFYQ